MKKFMSGLFASTIAVSMTMASMLPTEAAPMVPKAAMQTETTNGNLINVAEQGARRYPNRFRNGRNIYRHGNRGRDGFYRGHRGYRDYRRGYRRHGNYWFPAAAFITGAIVGGAINNGPVIRSGGSHTQWCYNRYRSYRASDNTYQPNNGPRRQCNSPY